MFNKKLSADTLRSIVECLVDEYGGALWAEAVRLAEDDEFAKQLWLAVFVVALRKIKPHHLERFGESWFKQLLAQLAAKKQVIQIAAAAAEAVTLPEVISEQRQTGQVEANGNDCDHDVPQALRTQVSQVLRATAGLMEAERRHKGPRWTLIATLATVLFGLLAVGYGLEGRYHVLGRGVPDGNDSTQTTAASR